MQMYVAEINGEAVVAFHASSERDAENRIAGSKGIAQDIIGVERMDGRPLWDCESPVTPRLATDEEREFVRKYLAEVGVVLEESRDWGMYLVPVIVPTAE